MRLSISSRQRWAVLPAAVLAATAAAVLVVGRSGGLPDDAAFSYEGTVVTEAQLSDRTDALGALYGVKEPEAEADRDAFRRDVAKAVVVSMILDDAVEAHDIVISDKAARDTLASMLDEQLGPDPRRSYLELLSTFHVSEGEVLAEVKRQQAIALLFQQLTKHDTAVSDADVREYFDTDPARFATPERRRIANIVVGTRAEAQALLRRAQRGADFAALARDHSLDDATRDKGGLLGTVAATELETRFSEAAFATDVHAVFGPVQTQFGWNVGLVRAVVPAREPDFEAVKAQVAETLRSERAMAVWQEWLAEQIKGADVEYAARYLPENPDEPPSTAVGMP